jgi:hypothetical protein
MRNAYKILVGKPEGKKPFGRPRHRWKVILQNIWEIWWECVDWTSLAQDND